MLMKNWLFDQDIYGQEHRILDCCHDMLVGVVCKGCGTNGYFEILHFLSNKQLLAQCSSVCKSNLQSQLETDDVKQRFQSQWEPCYIQHLRNASKRW